MSSPIAGWRLRLADLVAGGELTRRGRALAARPDHHARTVLGAVLARREVQAAVPPRLLAEWRTAHGSPPNTCGEGGRAEQVERR